MYPINKLSNIYDKQIRIRCEETRQKYLTCLENNFNDKFFKRILGIFKRKKKILVVANNNCFSFIWSINCFKPRFSSGTIYLYDFLSEFYSRYLSILSR